ncbi:MAG: S41 family peptidase [Phycisphaerae bacterium]
MESAHHIVAASPGGAGVRLLSLVVGLALLLPAAGCAVFPQGAYWPAHERGPSEGPPLENTDATEQASAPAARQRPLHSTADLQANITRRWLDEALADSARQMRGWAGRCVYADAMRTVVWCYVEPVSYRDLVVAGLESLRAALENPTFRERFGAAADAKRRERFAQALDILVLKAGAANPWFAFQAADWLAIAMEKNRAMLGLPDGAVVAEFLFGAMDALDPYTRFLTPDMLQAYDAQRTGRYSGIGATVARRNGRVVIEHVFKGGAAERAGLEAGDEVLSVTGEPVADLTLDEISARLRGKAGTKVTLSVRSGDQDEPREVVLIRTAVRVPAVHDAQMIDPQRRIGYVRVTAFRSGVEQELRRAVRALADQGAEALVLDLRDNPGGLLLSAVEVAGLLFGGRVAQTRGRMPGATWRYDTPLFARQAWRGPLVVLVNEGTASASEIVASALSRQGRALLVGRRTFGKGAVQICLPVDWGTSAVVVTIARAYDAKGRCLDGRGVAPDVTAPEADVRHETVGDDPMVRAAVESLRVPAHEP